MSPRLQLRAQAKSKAGRGLATPAAGTNCGQGANWGVLTSIPAGLQAGQTYTVSIWLRGANGGEGVVIGVNDCAATGFTLTNSWQRYTVTYPNISSAVASCEGGRGFEMLATGATYYAWGRRRSGRRQQGLTLPQVPPPRRYISTSQTIWDGRPWLPTRWAPFRTTPTTPLTGRRSPSRPATPTTTSLPAKNETQRVGSTTSAPGTTK